MRALKRRASFFHARARAEHGRSGLHNIGEDALHGVPDVRAMDVARVCFGAGEVAPVVLLVNFLLDQMLHDLLHIILPDAPPALEIGLVEIGHRDADDVRRSGHGWNFRGVANVFFDAASVWLLMQARDVWLCVTTRNGGPRCVDKDAMDGGLVNATGN